MSIIFNGKEYASKKKNLLISGVNLLREKGTIPHLANILIGDDKASVLYVNSKKKFLESIGCQNDIYKLTSHTKLEDVLLLIKTLNEDETVHGVMVQMPLPESLNKNKQEIINTISVDKDIDGLRDDSLFLHPTSKAVLEVLSLALFETKKEISNVCVVGASGMVGKPLVKELKKLNYEVTEVDKDTKDIINKTVICDVVISATGVVNLITPEMIKGDAIVIDVGSPFGDINPRVEEKVSFLTPVPGGVGPVTITCLAENLLVSVNDK